MYPGVISLRNRQGENLFTPFHSHLAEYCFLMLNPSHFQMPVGSGGLVCSILRGLRVAEKSGGRKWAVYLGQLHLHVVRLHLSTADHIRDAWSERQTESM